MIQPVFAGRGGPFEKVNEGASLVRILIADSRSKVRFALRALLENNFDLSYAEITANEGHDAFLMQNPHYLDVFRAYLDRVAIEVQA